MSLKEYRKKRDFRKTAEPAGGHVTKATGHRFVIQKHAASRLHYDFRLELGGTLKSWAVPKGVPFAKGEKRLAVQVEDHPVSYIDFEGTIPQGQYGGGTVMVWDRGTYESLSDAPAKELAGGKLHFVLHGKKLRGEWYLVRLREGNQWLLIRGKDDMRPVSKKLDDTSALSGKSLKQLGESRRVWNSKPAAPAPAVVRPRVDPKIEASRGLKFIAPMKARLVERPPVGDWLYEIKLDGFRTLALKEGQRARLLSRNEKDLGGKFPEVLAAVAELTVSEAIFDGEIVALDDRGHSSFQLLQQLEMTPDRPAIFYYVFDLLRWKKTDLRREPLAARKAKLKELLKGAPEVIRYSPSLEGDVAELLKHTRRLGLEGLIGKRKDSVYESGQRSGAWIKLKLNREQEMVIGGYSDPEGTRKYFGALLLGYQGPNGLRFAGKVGTGFNEAGLKNLHEQFRKNAREKCPFINLPEKRAGRYGQGVTPAEMKRCHWLAPKLVCQVKFSEWTHDGKLRQPVFLGLREDKDAGEVTREEP